MQASSAPIEPWTLRRRTLTAMALLAWARLLIALLPLRLWRARLGLVHAPGCSDPPDAHRTARTMARHVERASERLPFARKCLPRAMALSILLRRIGIAHQVVFAVRQRGKGAASRDRLHAWVEQDGVLLIGDEPGPWIEVLRLGTLA